MPTTNNIFSYSSNPLPVKPSNSRKKYKDDGNNFTLMSDPRVVRGMVSSSLKKSLPEKISKDTSSSSHRHNHGRNIDEKNEKRQFDEMHGSGSTHGSGHGTGMYSYNVSSIVQENIDVTQYLIEQESNKPIQKVHETQTDDFQERPLTPEYIPKKTGIDRSTQVENPADLFLFDEEVELIVSVIAAKTLEQSLYEIEQEVELTSLQQRIEYFHQQKLIENQWIKKREEESIADACIKDLALKGMKEKVTHENLVREKVAARQTMIQLLPKMVGEVIDELYEENIWVEPSKEFILKEMVPEMKRVVRTRAELYEHVTEILDELLWEAQQKEIILPDPPRAPTPSPASSPPQKRQILLTIHLPDDLPTIGPLAIEEGETMASLKDKIQNHIDEEDLQLAMFPLERYLASALGYLSPRDMDAEAPLEIVRLPDRIEL